MYYYGSLSTKNHSKNRNNLDIFPKKGCHLLNKISCSTQANIQTDELNFTQIRRIADYMHIMVAGVKSR